MRPLTTRNERRVNALATPLLLQSPLTGSYYIATRYMHKSAPNGALYIETRTKYDCTIVVNAIIAEATAPLYREIARLRNTITPAELTDEDADKLEVFYGVATLHDMASLAPAKAFDDGMAVIRAMQERLTPAATPLTAEIEHRKD